MTSKGLKLRDIIKQIEYQRGDLLKAKPNDFFPIKSDEYLTLKCFAKDLEYVDKRDTRDFCSALLYYNKLVSNETLLTFFIPTGLNKKRQFQVAFSSCHTIRGTPLIASSAEEFNKTFHFLNGTKNNLIWNEAYVDDKGDLWWCGYDSLKVPVPLDSGADLIADFPFYLVSLASSRPNLHAVHMDFNISISKMFCQIPKSVANKCLKYPQYFKNYTYYKLPLPDDIEL
ncbi:uncharacterized protein LOC132201553 [Neocloeon triangulifer]|uniref:uncharacterized protein LOC132201553 n=1 Tax=Neocloeon triangulifer TaxID=2078957 RepID=UPI00286F5103|nr:uncharacterized protein LOC132201553 [Neocloeon triangulifer]